MFGVVIVNEESSGLGKKWWWPVFIQTLCNAHKVIHGQAVCVSISTYRI
jgi:hypothetical protein